MIELILIAALAGYVFYLRLELKKAKRNDYRDEKGRFRKGPR